jgi:hypothetical protein
MKKPVKSSVNKMIAHFDNELKAILQNELQAIRTKNFLNAIKNSMGTRLNAA